MIVLGIDGGGTKTHALALDEHGTVLGSGVGGPSYYHSLGLDRTMAVLSDVSKQALGDQQADYAVFCLGACDSPRDEARLTARIQPLGITHQFKCRNDAYAALRAGSRYPYGVGVICGSGINVCALAPDGRSFALFSLGSYTGDWGGGHDLGAAALGAIYRAEDGRGTPTALTEPVLKALGVPDLVVLAERITDRQVSYPQVASLGPLVFTAANAGDAVARAILQRLADEIAVGVSAMLRRSGMESMDVDVALAGGVMHGDGPLLIDSITRQITVQHPKAQVSRVNVPPVVGAVFLACDALHITPPDIGRLKLPSQTMLASLPTDR